MDPSGLSVEPYLCLLRSRGTPGASRPASDRTVHSSDHAVAGHLYGHWLVRLTSFVQTSRRPRADRGLPRLGSWWSSRASKEPAFLAIVHIINGVPRSAWALAWPFRYLDFLDGSLSNFPHPVSPYPKRAFICRESESRYFLQSLRWEGPAWAETAWRASFVGVTGASAFIHGAPIH